MKRPLMNNYGDLIYIDTQYKPSVGSFGKPKFFDNNRYVVNTWQHCREIWHNQMYNAKIFFYVHPAAKNKSIAVFFEKIEDRLNLKIRSIFGPTQKKSILYVKPSKWWLRYAMRRSLFTILMRSSCNYDFDLDNFEDSLYSNNYANKSKMAIEHFLNGNTVYTGRKRGWFKQFGEIPVDQCDLMKLLVPEKNQ